MDSKSTVKKRGPALKSIDENKEQNDTTKTRSETQEKKSSKQKSKSKGPIELLDAFCTNQSFLILLTLRTVSVCFNLVWDCDEVYNYWEPLHFIIFGDGFQTWEYSPAYSLRSYLYIYLHAIPLMPIVNFFEKMTLFYLLRFLFAVVSSKIESYLFESLLRLAKGHQEYERISKYFLLFCFTNVGMFLSTTSFLPSTFSMYLVIILIDSSNKSFGFSLAKV
jgi:hypothetical protein